MKKGLTEIICILDRSGSMNATINDAIGGFNSFIETQKKVPGEAKVTLVLFDDQYDIIESGKDIGKIKLLNESTYVPRGMTALLDAVGKTINNVGTRLASTEEDERPEKVMVAILTDGEENASKEFTKEKVNEMIEHQKTKYQWDFVFLAANQDAIQAGTSIGINAQSCFAYVANGVGTRSAYNNLTSYTTNFRGSK